MNILVKLELDVKAQFAKNPYDENMYVVLRTLTEKILVVKNLVTDREDVDQVAHDYAINLWLRLCNGVVINNWTKYIMLNVSSTLYNYYKAHNRTQIETTILDPVAKDSFITKMYGSSNRNEYIRKFELEDYLQTLFEEIKVDVLRFSRTTNIVFNRKLYLSVIANFFNEKAVIGLSEDYASYVDFICKLVRKSIYEKSMETLNNHEYSTLQAIIDADAAVENYSHANKGGFE